MAVKIDIELQAGDAETELLAIAGALETLDDAVSDAELDLDGLDVDEISGEIGNMVDMLENMDLDLSALDRRLDRIENMDAIEMDATLHTPDGDTGSGDSVGDDPPVEIRSGFLDAQRRAMAEGDGGLDQSSIQKISGALEDRSGLDPGEVRAFQTDEDGLANLQKDFFHNVHGNDHPTRNLNPPDEIIDGGVSFGTDQGFGMEHPDMTGLRKFFLSLQEREQMKEQEAGGDLPYETFDSDLHRRVSESNAIEDTLEDIKEDQRELLDNAGLDADAIDDGDQDVTQRKRQTFADMNQDIRDSVPETDAEIDRATSGGGGMPDFKRVSTRQILRNTRFGQKASEIESVGDAVRGLKSANGGLNSSLRRFKPTMGKYMQLLAALIPIAVALGTQLLGVAAAMGSVAAAGAGIIGLGLLGQGESMGAAFSNARNELNELKQDMFDTFQPAMQQFSPIQQRAFDEAPAMVRPIAKAMEGLTVYEDTLFELGNAFAGGMAEAIDIIVENEQAISDLATTFGGILGSGLLDFFEFLILSASKNKQLIFELGSAIVRLATIAFNVSMVIGRVLAALEPLLAGLEFLSGLLNNKIIVGLLTFITTSLVMFKIFTMMATKIYAVVTAIQAMATWLAYLGGGSILAGISAMFSTLLIYAEAAIAHFLALESAALKAALAIAATGIGAAVVLGGALAGGAALSAMESAGGGGGGGASPSRGASRGGQTVYNDNREYTFNNSGEMDHDAEQRMRSQIEQTGNENAAMNPNN